MHWQRTHSEDMYSELQFSLCCPRFHVIMTDIVNRKERALWSSPTAEYLNDSEEEDVTSQGTKKNLAWK